MFTGWGEQILDPDLIQRYEGGIDVGVVDEEVYPVLVNILRRRTLMEWIDFGLQYDVPVGPANTPEELSKDPHFLARDNIYEVEQPGGGGEPCAYPEPPLKQNIKILLRKRRRSYGRTPTIC